MLVYLPWIASGLGIIGAILNVLKWKSCFIIWTLGNCIWGYLTIYIPPYRPQIPLWLVYTIINCLGYFQWKGEEK